MKWKNARGWVLIAAMASHAGAQTRIDLRTQGKNPTRTGAALPASCEAGEMFVKTDAPAGSNLYACTAANTWTLQSGSVAATAADSDKVLSNNGASTGWRAIGGDISGKPDSLTVNRLLGRPLSQAMPADGHALLWNGTASAWEPRFQSAGGDVTGTLPNLTVTRLQNLPISAMTPGPGQVLTWSGSQWAPQTAAGTVASIFGRTGSVAAQAGDYSFGQISGTVSASQLPGAGGDLSGTLTNATVGRLQNRAVSTATPANGQVLAWSGSQWTPQNVPSAAVGSVFGRTGAITPQLGDYSFSQISGTAANSQLPALGGDLTGTLSAATVSQIQNRPVSTTAPSAGQVLTWSGTQWAPQAAAAAAVGSVFGRTGMISAQTGDYSFSQISGAVGASQLPSAGGDLAGTLANATVSRLQNRPVATTVPANGQVLAWNGTQWAPQNTGAATVTSIFGRIGNVDAQAGDYTASQITNAVDKTAANTYAAGAKQTFAANAFTPGLRILPSTLPSMPAAGDVAVDAADNRFKVFDGSGWTALATPPPNYGTTFTGQTTVTIPGTTHGFGTANLLVSCYDTGVPAAHVEPDTVTIHPATFDVTVTFAVPQSGRCVVNGSGGAAGSGGGASIGTQLGDLAVTKASDTELSVGASCSPVTPCNVRMGNTVYSFVAPASVTLTGGTGTLYLYVTASGDLTAGHMMNVSCTGCTAQSGITGFPANTVPLFTWTATSGTWDATGGVDRRAFLSGKVISAGTGMVTIDTGAQTTVAVDAATVPTYVAGAAVLDFPGIANAACSADYTFTLPGAAADDAVAPGWPAGLPGGVLGVMRVSSPNTIAVRLCNFSGSSVDPPSATYQASIVRSF